MIIRREVEFPFTFLFSNREKVLIVLLFTASRHHLNFYLPMLPKLDSLQNQLPIQNTVFLLLNFLLPKSRLIP